MAGRWRPSALVAVLPVLFPRVLGQGLDAAACMLCSNCSLPVGSAMTSRPRYRLSMATLVNDEGRWLAEWILYHRIVGFDHFYMYDDSSTDNTLAVLEHFQTSGIVTIHRDMERVEREMSIEVPSRVRFIPQYVMVQHAARVHGSETEWLAFFDVDEFLMPRQTWCLGAMLDAAKPKQGVLRLTGHLFLPDEHDHAPLAPHRLLVDTAKRFVPDRLLAGPDRVPLHKNLARPSAIAHWDHQGIHQMKAKPPFTEHLVKKADVSFAHFRYRTLADFERKKHKKFRGHTGKAEVLRRLESQLQVYLRSAVDVGEGHPFHRYLPALRAQYALTRSAMAH